MSEVNVQLGQDLIKPIIEAKVQAAITQAVESESKLVTKFIANALQIKVNKNGVVDSYSHSNKYTFLEYLCYETIRNCAKNAIKDWIKENRPQIEKALKAQLKTTKQTTTLAKALINGMTKSVQSDWRMHVSIKLSSIEDD